LMLFMGEPTGEPMY